jgi:hypothetical protein
VPPDPNSFLRKLCDLVLKGALARGIVSVIVGNDWVVRHDNRYFQVQAQSRQYAPAKGKVTVCEWENGRLQIRYRDRAVSWEKIPGPVSAEAVRTMEAKAKKPKPPTPRADHPWRQDYRKIGPWSKPGQVPLIQEMSG